MTIEYSRATAFAAIDAMYASLRLLNATESVDGSAPEYRIFAVQDRATADRPATPFQSVSDAIDTALSIIAAIDGFRGDDVRRIVSYAYDVMGDMFGDRPAVAADAYAHSVNTLMADVWEEAEAVAEDMRATGHATYAAYYADMYTAAS